MEIISLIQSNLAKKGVKKAYLKFVLERFLHQMPNEMASMHE